MGKKGRKTRWRKLPIPIGTGNGRGGWEEGETEEPKRQQPLQPISPSTFNEDEYTRITTPRQDMLFKKGYLGKKKTSAPPQDTTDAQSAGDSVESESYVCDEAANQYMYPGGYIDPSGMYYVNNGYEMYDPYTGAVTVIVGPGPQNGYGPQVLAAVPCAPLPLQPLEWFNPAAPQPQFPVPPTYLHRKKRSSVDSQNCSGQSSETTCNPGSPPEPMEGIPDTNGQPFYPPQYVYPGAYMFGAPLYNMNGVSVQGLVPPAAAPPPADPAKRRKKRRRRRRGGAVTDEGSESSCEEVLGCEAGNESQSGASSDTALGSSSSKTNSDSGIHTDPTTHSGSDSPQILESDSPQILESDSPQILESNSPQILEPNYYYPISPTKNLVEPPNSPHNNPPEKVPSPKPQQCKVTDQPQEQAELNCTTNEPAIEFEAKSESLALITCDVASAEVCTVSVSAQPCDELILSLEESLECPERNPEPPESSPGQTQVPQESRTDRTQEPPESSPGQTQVPQESRTDRTQEPPESCPDRIQEQLESCPEPTLVISESFLDLTQAPPESCSDDLKSLPTPVPSQDYEQHIETNHQEELESIPCSNRLQYEPLLSLDLENLTDFQPLELPEANLTEELQDGAITSSENEQKIDVVSEEEQCTSDFASTPASPLTPAEDYYTSDETEPTPLSPLCDSLVSSEPELPSPGYAHSEFVDESVSVTFGGEDTTATDKAVQLEELCNKIESNLYFEPEVVVNGVFEDIEEHKVVLNDIREEYISRAPDRPITQAVTKWLESQGSSALSSSIVADGERIEEGVDPLTGQKNGEGNPFLASSPSDSRTRVAETNSGADWDVSDRETRVRAMCDPKSSVEKYYRLAAETASEKSITPSNGKKTAMHIGRAGPFPCGICCILQ